MLYMAFQLLNYFEVTINKNPNGESCIHYIMIYTYLLFERLKSCLYYLYLDLLIILKFAALAFLLEKKKDMLLTVQTGTFMWIVVWLSKEGDHDLQFGITFNWYINVKWSAIWEINWTQCNVKNGYAWIQYTESITDSMYTAMATHLHAEGVTDNL